MSQFYIGILILAIGALAHSFAYVPLNMVNGWSWESFSFVKGIFAYIFIPWAASMLALPEGYLYFELYAEVPMWQLFSTVAMGSMWALSVVFLEKSMFYLGAEKGKAVSTAMNATFAILLPALILHTLFFHTHPEWEWSIAVWVGCAVIWVGYLLVGKAGNRKNVETYSPQDDDRRQFNTLRGWLFALLGGLLAACLNGGLAMGDGIYLPETQVVYQALPSIFLMGIGAFATNTIYCLVLNAKHHSFNDYSQPLIWKTNLIIAILVAALEFAPLYALSVGRVFFKDAASLVHYAFPVLLVFQTIFTYPWQFLMQEWRGASYQSLKLLLWGIIILLVAVFLPVALV